LRAVCLCGPIHDLTTIQGLPGILLCGVRTFLTIKRAHLADLSDLRIAECGGKVKRSRMGVNKNDGIRVGGCPKSPKVSFVFEKGKGVPCYAGTGAFSIRRYIFGWGPRRVDGRAAACVPLGKPPLAGCVNQRGIGCV